MGAEMGLIMGAAAGVMDGEMAGVMDGEMAGDEGFDENAAPYPGPVCARPSCTSSWRPFSISCWILPGEGSTPTPEEAATLWQ